ncbi:C6 transcription factor [Ilyonectria destructans]|nr:C6 transcription factor [Ilyonectria destructans]
MPRLYHTKSKTGCKRCRARRVKCDESRPTCGSCRRHKVECTYDREESGNATHANGTSRRNHSPSITESRERRHRELELLHFFTVQTTRTLSSTHLPELLETWSVEVPRLALSYDPLLDAIMAFSSHHMARIAKTQEKREEYLTLRSLYLESTLHKHRQAVGDLSRENADAVSFTTVILTIDAFANLRERQLEPYEPPTQWIQISRGVGSVCKLALDLIKDDDDAMIRPLIDTMMPFIGMYHSNRKENIAVFAHLLVPQDGEMMDADNMQAYETTASLLGWILAGHKSGENLKMYCRRLTTFPVLLPDHFITLLERQDPRALVLLAHFFALASYATEFWWIGEVPYREICAIQGHLSPEWQGMAAEPVQAVQAHAPGRAEQGLSR